MTKVFKPTELRKQVTIQYDRILLEKVHWIDIEVDGKSYFFQKNMIGHDRELKQITAPFWIIRDKELEDYIVE